jgi:ribose-phosphate pyrophosphokinase
MAAMLARALDGEVCVPELRAFPDGETYFRLDKDLHGHTVALVSTLDRPDAKLLSLLFAAGTASDLGAASVGLVAPYLAYMRQDRRFLPGEAVSARLFASVLWPHIDWLVTVDPHLHRVHVLADIYPIATRVVHAAHEVAKWIVREVADPVLIGPDAESTQWVQDVARNAGAGFVVLKKSRQGDRDVKLSMPDMAAWRDRTPVLVDDIISTGGTMLETLAHLRDGGMKPAICIAVHGVFAAGAYEALSAFAPARIVTTNTIVHQTNAIDVSAILADAIREVAA